MSQTSSRPRDSSVRSSRGPGVAPSDSPRIADGATVATTLTVETASRRPRSWIARQTRRTGAGGPAGPGRAIVDGSWQPPGTVRTRTQTRLALALAVTQELIHR